MNEIEIKRLTENDLDQFEELIRLFHVVFESGEKYTPQTSYLKGILAKPHFVALAILHKNKIVGGLTAYELPLYTAESSEMYLYDIAIKDEFQRKGLGIKIITALKEYCRSNNINQFFVEAHTSDQYAVDFYKKAGGDAEEVVHFNFNFNFNTNE